MMLEAAPTPCRRIGFHMISRSLWAACVEVTPAAPAVVHAVGPAVVLPVGAMVNKSPGLAASIALWIVAEAATGGGALPPIVTVTVSIERLPAKVARGLTVAV